MDGRPLQRRHLLTATGVLALGAVAGCTAGVEDIPDPNVVQVFPSDLTDVAGGQEVEATATVHNVGAAGEIEIRFETTAPDFEDPLDTATDRFEVERESQANFSTTIQVSASAERLTATASAVEE